MLQPKVKMEIMRDTESRYPDEISGVVIQNGKRQRYIPLTNVAENKLEFSSPDPDEYHAASLEGEIIAYVHSHTGDGASTIPSATDRAECNTHEIPYVITSWPEGDLRILMPEKLPLIGRPWSLGHYDCWSLIMAFHAEHGIKLNNYSVDREWWKDGSGDNFYDENWEKEGFQIVDRAPVYGDMIMMQLQSSVTNHAGIYLDGNRFMHHYSNRLSKVDLYAGYYMDHTVRVVRHKDLPDDIAVIEELKEWSN